MRIKTQFIITMGLFGVTLAAIATSMMLTKWRMAQQRDQEKLAADIERGVSDLGYLSHEYMLYHEEQQRARWESKFSTLVNNLSRVTATRPEQREIVNNMRENLIRLKAVLADVSAHLETPPDAPPPMSLIQVSGSRLAVQNQGIFSDAMRLSHAVHEQSDQIRRARHALSFVLIGLFGASLLSFYVLTYRRTLKAMAALQAGTGIVGRGDLDHLVPVRHNDEIGELAHAFNRMSASLKDVTASKAAFERELAERERAEEELRKMNETLERRVAERTADVRQLADQLRALAAELSQAEQRERKRLATILHDHIQQLLVAAKMQLTLVERVDAQNLPAVARGIESILNDAIDASRSLTVELSPPILHQAGLAAALGWLATRLEEKSLFKVTVRVDNDAEPSAEPVRLLLFESVRELLLNAAKHSGTREATVLMARTDDNWTKIVVQDNGQGFHAKGGEHRGNGFGLFSIQQRLTYLGGRCEIESAPGQGARVTLLAPPGACGTA